MACQHKWALSLVLPSCRYPPLVGEEGRGRGLRIEAEMGRRED